MKAIACPQCGALIKKITVKDKIVFCDYCEAKIILPKDQNFFIETPEREENAAESNEKKLTPWEQHQENYRKVRERAARYNDTYTYPQPQNKSYVFPLLLAFIGIGLFIIILVFKYDSRPAEVKETIKLKTNSSPKIEFSFPTPLPPQINYEVKVQWSGKYDMEHYENPQIDTSKLPSLDEKELKKTVFKNRGVQVKITIDTNGEVSSAEAISGHPVLKEAAVEAAKKTLFNSRQKPTVRILTYYFRLTDG